MKLIKGNVYKVDARNFGFAVYDGNNGFIGVREKWGDKYLFTEILYEADDVYGTVKVEEDTGFKFMGEINEDYDNLELIGFLDLMMYPEEVPF